MVGPSRSTRVEVRRSCCSACGGGESAGTPDSVTAACAAAGGHPSRPAVARRLQRPTRGSEGGPPSPCLALLRVGFAEPPGSPRALVRSYRTVSPLPVPPLPEGTGRPSAVCSLWHFPAGHPDWALPSTLPCGVRTFLGRVTAASPRWARTRPPGRLTTATMIARAPATHRLLLTQRRAQRGHRASVGKTSRTSSVMTSPARGRAPPLRAGRVA